MQNPSRFSKNPITLQRAPHQSKGVTGLQNLGNTSYLNSALQCLSNTPHLQDYLLGGFYGKELDRENRMDLGGTLTKALEEIIQKLWSSSNGSESPLDLKLLVEQFRPQFEGSSQHDTQELLAFFLDGLHEDLNRIQKKPWVKFSDWEGGDEDEKELAEFARNQWDLYKTRNDSVIVDLFQGQSKSTLTCLVCDNVSIKFDPFMHLTLPIPTSSETGQTTVEDEQLGSSSRLAAEKEGLTLEDCLDEFTKGEKLGEDDPWYCPKCKEFRQATKKNELWKVPDILVVHLKRFSGENRTNKLDHDIDFPIKGLDLTERISGTQIYQDLEVSGGLPPTSVKVNGNVGTEGIKVDDDDEAVASDQPIYDLYAINNHSGDGEDGHYTAFAKNSTDKNWYYFDDAKTNIVTDVDSIKTPAAYVLFYCRRTMRENIWSSTDLCQKTLQPLPKNSGAIIPPFQVPTPAPAPFVLNMTGQLSPQSLYEEWKRERGL